MGDPIWNKLVGGYQRHETDRVGQPFQGATVHMGSTYSVAEADHSFEKQKPATSVTDPNNITRG